MYDELIKRLRELQALTERCDEQSCFECKNRELCYKHDNTTLSKTYKQAADAIEELSKLADAIPHVCECCVGCELEKKDGGCDHAFVLSQKRAMQHLIKPRWNSVTEKPPLKIGDDGYNGYLVYANGYYEVADFTIGKFDNAPYFYVNGEYEPTVTHWMSLPEPPKEET